MAWTGTHARVAAVALVAPGRGRRHARSFLSCLLLLSGAACVDAAGLPASTATGGAGGGGGVGGSGQGGGGGAGGVAPQRCRFQPGFRPDDQRWLLATRGISENGHDPGFGRVFLIGRLDADAEDDLVVGASWEGVDGAGLPDRQGQVVVVFGPLGDQDLAQPARASTTPWLLLMGDRPFERLGSSLAILPRGGHGALAIGSGPSVVEDAPEQRPLEGQRAFLLDGAQLRALAAADGPRVSLDDVGPGAAFATFPPTHEEGRPESVRVAAVPRPTAGAWLLLARPDSVDAGGQAGEVVLLDAEEAFGAGSLDPATLPLRARIRGGVGDASIGWTTARGRTVLALGAPRGPDGPGATLLTLPEEEGAVVERSALFPLQGEPLTDPNALPGESFAVRVTEQGARLFVAASRAFRGEGAVASIDLDSDGALVGPGPLLRAPPEEVTELGRGLTLIPDGELVVSAPGADDEGRVNSGLVFGVDDRALPVGGEASRVAEVASFRLGVADRGASLGYRSDVSSDGGTLWLSAPTWDAGRLLGLDVASARACPPR